jgi:hypothetical protein
MQVTEQNKGLIAPCENAQHPAMLFITQPTYLPWIGIFKAISLSDTYVFYDDTQFEKQSWQNRNRVLDPARHQALMLTVPISKHPTDTAIRDIRIADLGFYNDHVRKLRAWYRRAPFLEPTLEVLQEAYSQRNAGLADLTSGLTIALARYLGFRTSFKWSSESTIQGDKYTRPLAFARSLGCSVYLTQVGTKDYTNIAAFSACGIRVVFLQFPHPEYRQLSKPFVPYLSIVDMLMNIGPEESAAVIEGIELGSGEVGSGVQG